jgi:hypothetical protein
MISQAEMIEKLEKNFRSPPFGTLSIEEKGYAIEVRNAHASKIFDASQFEPHGWYATRERDSLDISDLIMRPVILEPVDESDIPCCQKIDTYYHISPIKNDFSIHTRGLHLTDGVSTFTKRKFRFGRVHLANDFASCSQYIWSRYINEGLRGRFAIYEIDARDQEILVHDDPFFQGRGVWTSAIIPAMLITKCAELELM